MIMKPEWIEVNLPWDYYEQGNSIGIDEKTRNAIEVVWKAEKK